MFNNGVDYSIGNGVHVNQRYSFIYYLIALGLTHLLCNYVGIGQTI